MAKLTKTPGWQIKAFTREVEKLLAHVTLVNRAITEKSLKPGEKIPIRVNVWPS